MEISIQNIGKLKKANVKVRSITTIAGANDTGKSTIGKVLFAVTNSFYQLDQRIEEEKLSKLISLFKESIKKDDPVFFTDALKRVQEQRRNPQPFSLFSSNLIEFCQDYQVALGDMVEEICQFPKEDIAMEFIGSHLYEEFGTQINNFHTNEEGIISFSKDNMTKNLVISDNQLVSVKNLDDLTHTVAFIDDPYVLDYLSHEQLKYWNDHRQHLIDKLCTKSQEKSNVLDKIQTKKRLDALLDLIDPICAGNLEEGTMLEYRFKLRSGKSMELKNVSAGIKTFIIIKTLLQQGALVEGGLLILDEPEVHLHPQWQLVFAELIVLLQKEFHLHVLLTTHSPYFLEAIEVYTVKHGISQDCNYYLAENQNDVATLTEVTDSVDHIYSLLAKPFQTLENEGANNDESI